MTDAFKRELCVNAYLWTMSSARVDDVGSELAM